MCETVKTLIIVGVLTGIFLAAAGLLAGGGASGSPGSAGNALMETPGRIESGMLYFRRDGFDPRRRMWAMGAGDHHGAALPEGVDGEPSHRLHAGHRWFLTIRDTTDGTRPLHHGRAELFAVREDGRAVRLTNDSNLEPAHAVARWIPNSADRRISWVARRHGADGAIAEGGMYEAAVLFDDHGHLIGLAESPPVLRLPLELIESCNDGSAVNAPWPDIRSHDWSPDGESIVYDALQGKLVVVNLGTGAAVVLDERASCPSWSPDGQTIAFKRVETLAEIVTVRPDGSGRKCAIDPAMVSRWFAATAPLWSPDGRYFVYQRVVCDATPYEAPCDMDVIAMTPDGRERINLTGEVPGFTSPVAWR